MSLRFTIAIGILCGACGDDGSLAIDAPMTIDIDNGSCGDQIRFTGELVDWDSDTAFCGVNNAQFEVQGGNGGMDSTAPNGRFDLCVPDAATTLLDITPDAAPSGCTNPPAAYTVGGIAVANKTVIQAGGFFSGRLFTTARQTTLFQAIGQPVDPAKAHVFVHVNGTPRAVSIAAAHAPTQAVATTTWAPGDTGKDVFFPNVDAGGGSTMLSVTGGAVGAGSIPLAAGKITIVSVIAQ
jgi:hypothetical protein